MTSHGTLTDFEGTTARIDDKPIHMWDAAAKFCAERLRKGMKVSYEIRDTKIVKIWEDTSKDIAGDAVEEAKRKAAGFFNPEPAPSENCTSPDKPAPVVNPPNPTGLKIVEGQIVAINQQARTIAVKDRSGITHPFRWKEPQDSAMSRLQQWYFTRITGEQRGEDLYVTSQEFFRKPADWPAGNHGGHAGGRPGYAPRNEKPMLYESVFKSLCEMFDGERDGKGKSWEENARRIWAMTEEIGDKMAAKAGVQ